MAEPITQHELPTPPDFWRWSCEVYGARSQEWLTVQALGGSVNLALLLHRLDQLGIVVDLADLQPVLAQTEAEISRWRTLRQSAKAQLDEEGYQVMLTHELALERQQQGALLQALHNLILFRGKGHNLSNYLSQLGAQEGPLRDLIC